jgi:N-acetyl sugar amidotransferase
MTNDREYQVCTRCVMDTTDPDIIFDLNGVCNHCLDYDIRKKVIAIDPSEKKIALDEIVKSVKQSGKGKEYDCIIGVSGGIDSSYVAYLAKNWGLNGLLVHLDNGWDSELAVKNIENIVEYTGFDLYTLVIDWEEFKDLQRSFFMADVIDLELLSDHAIFATVYRLARKYKIKYLLSGENFETEAIMPKAWNWRKSDARNIKAIQKIYGSKKIKTFPIMGTVVKLLYQYSGLAKSIPILNYLNYNKDDAMRIMQLEMNWKYYGGKHYESIFTRFYQGYILPEKFKVDKRKAHYSTLINSGQMIRDDALLSLQTSTYSDHLKKEDFELLCKKLGFENKEFMDYLKRLPKSHNDYKNDDAIYNLLLKANFLIKKIGGRFR